jgi:hypothetical protein
MATPLKTFTDKELENYFKNGLRYCFYKEAKCKHDEFLPHSDGTKPLGIIDKQRPNEPEVIKAFRLDIWEPITKPTFARVLSSLNKIRRSSDWGIVYPKEQFAKIPDKETLEEYCEKYFPYFTSVTNWVFSVLLKQYAIDSNAVVFVKPLFTDIEENSYLEPFPMIFNSCDVIEFKEREYAILKIASGCTYYDSNNRMKHGESYYVVTTMYILRYDQVNEDRNFNITYEYYHNLNYLTVFKNGGVICDSIENDYLYESRISGMLPNLNEAIAEYTDLQAGKRLNIYPERWEISEHECPKCNGLGRINNLNWKAGDSMTDRYFACNACVNGVIASGPFSKMVLKAAKVGENPLPTPPAGYIEKDIEIIRLMDESVDKHIYKSLAAINFQFLEQVPQAQSGIAKEVDKEELNNTVHGIAEDIVSLMDKIYKSIAYYRYNKVYSIEEIDRMLPTIAVPEHFDIISSQYMQEEIKTAREAKLNPLLISQMEVEFGARRFALDVDVNVLIRLVNQLDPFPGNTIDEKLGMSSTGSVTKEDIIISNNIISFIRRALFENEDFAEWERDKQLETLNSYADEIVSELNEAAQQAKAVIDEGNDNTDNNEGDNAPTE